MKNRTNKLNTLIETVDYWADNLYLFGGGCCFAAAEIAKIFERVGIRYDVVGFLYNDSIGVHQFNNLNGTCGLGHIAIRVRLNGKFVFIGDASRTAACFDMNGVEWEQHVYRNVNSKDLEYMYKNNDWNTMWMTFLNKHFISSINKIFK